MNKDRWFEILKWMLCSCEWVLTSWSSTKRKCWVTSTILATIRNICRMQRHLFDNFVLWINKSLFCLYITLWKQVANLISIQNKVVRFIFDFKIWIFPGNHIQTNVPIIPYFWIRINHQVSWFNICKLLMIYSHLRLDLIWIHRLLSWWLWLHLRLASQMWIWRTTTHKRLLARFEDIKQGHDTIIVKALSF